MHQPQLQEPLASIARHAHGHPHPTETHTHTERVFFLGGGFGLSESGDPRVNAGQSQLPLSLPPSMLGSGTGMKVKSCVLSRQC